MGTVRNYLAKHEVVAGSACFGNIFRVKVPNQNKTKQYCISQVPADRYAAQILLAFGAWGESACPNRTRHMLHQDTKKASVCDSSRQYKTQVSHSRGVDVLVEGEELEALVEALHLSRQRPAKTRHSSEQDPFHIANQRRTTPTD